MSGLMLFSQYDPQTPQSSMARLMMRGTNAARSTLRSKRQKRLFIKHFMRAADDGERDPAPLESLAMEGIEQ
jgi:hypothetical protein